MTKKQVVIIDYGSGNIRSAAKAFEHVIEQNNLDFDVIVSSKSEGLDTASHIVLPGQGAFGDCMKGLQAVDGMIEALERNVLTQKKPFLGICVGMQLLADRGFEYGEHQGLGWIAGDVVPIEVTDSTLKIPHMGWNVCDYPHVVSSSTAHRALKGQEKNSTYHGNHFYFVHSFMFKCKDDQNVLGQVQYGGDVTAIVGRANILGVQFHPEKSQEAGLTLLNDFLLWDGA